MKKAAAALLPPDTYKLITKSVPIICVDLIPAQFIGGGWQLGIITRATGSEAGKSALVGGRVRHNELLNDAIKRHLKQDCSIDRFDFWGVNSIDHPFLVQQYLHSDWVEPPLGYDPSKHSIALTYLIRLSEEPKARNEASAFKWIDKNELPKTSAFNHHMAMSKAFETLEQGVKVPS